MINKDFYGDDVRWFVGTAINRFDPDLLGRIQVQIHGVHSKQQQDVPFSALPWASVLLPSNQGGTSGHAVVPQILPGATVFGIFLDGRHSQLPLVLGTIPKVEIPSDWQQELIKKTQTRVPYNRYTVDPTVSADKTDRSSAVNSNIPPEAARVGTEVTQKRRLAAMKFFVDNGYNTIQAAGIVGNLDYESSGLNTAIKADGSERSYGLAQWNMSFGRFQALEAYASSLNKPWTDFEVQLQFVIEELEGRTPYKEYTTANKNLKKCTSFYGGQVEENSTWIVMDQYERPEFNTSLGDRQKRAKTAYDAYTNSWVNNHGV